MLTADDVQLYSKDSPVYNILLEGEEQSSVDLINLAMRMAVSSFNAVPPATSYSVIDFPSDALLMDGTLYCLANGEAERQLRNQINFNIQGGQASVDDKHQQYIALATFYKTLFDQKTVALKQHLNIESAWGESYSPYIAINDFDFRD